MVIEPQGDVAEAIKEIEDGRKVVKYKGLFIHAFKKDALLSPAPNTEPFKN